MGFSPLIEKALLNNYATLRNYSIGGSGLSKIDIPANHFGIITDFTYFPFVYTENIAVGDVELNLEAFQFQEVCFYVNNKPYKYTFKINWGVFDTGQGPLTGHYYFPLQNFPVSTFIYCDSSPYVIIKNPQLLNGAGSVTDFGTLTSSQNPPPNEGYGTTENTIKQIADLNGNIYCFPNLKESGTNPAQSASQTLNSQSATDLYPATIGGAPTSNVQLPLLNVHMVLVAEQNRNLLNIRD